MTIAKDFAAKAFVAFVAAAMMISLFAPAAKAQTAEELQTQIDNLMAQIATLQAQVGQGGTSASGVCPFTWTRNLNMGATGADVMKLQQFLNGDADTRVAATGAGSVGSETEYYGALTGAAVAKFQVMYRADILTPLGMVNPSTFFGPSTRAKANSVCVTAPVVTPVDPDAPTPVGELEGGAGSITVNDSSTFAAEEVGEGEEDVEVLEFEVEAEGSDIAISSVKVEFVQGTAADSENLADYAESVSIWFDGEKVGESDANDFSESSDVYTRSISLDDGVIIRDGDTEMLVVAVTALNNLDSGDIDTDAWTADVLNVRFLDAEGVTTTEDTDGDALEQTFDFAAFADSTDLELKVSSGDVAINDAHVINVHATNVTDNVELLSFNIEAEGTTDVLIKDLPVVITTTETTGNDPDDLITLLYLYTADGEKIGTESLVTTDGDDSSETVTFNNIDYTVAAGDTVEFVVKAKLVALSGALDAGDTISADITATERALINAQDESGEDVATTDMTGTATGDAHSVRDTGINVAFVSSSAVITHTGDPAGTNDHDQGTFKIAFDVTAFDGDMYFDGTAPTDAGTAEHDLAIAGAETVLGSVITSTSGATLSGTVNVDARFLIEEGTTESFEITVTLAPTADGYFELSMTDFIYAITDVTGDVAYTFNLDEFKTPQLYMNFDA